MNREVYRPLLETAVENTSRIFPNFKGVVIFGSFVTDKPVPNDLDIIPVFQIYEGNWDFSPVSEGDFCDDHPDYFEFCDTEKYFLSHFPIIFTQEEILRQCLCKNKQRGVHYESVVALNDPERLKHEVVEHYHADPNNFVGQEQARKTLLELFKE